MPRQAILKQRFVLHVVTEGDKLSQLFSIQRYPPASPSFVLASGFTKLWFCTDSKYDWKKKKRSQPVKSWGKVRPQSMYAAIAGKHLCNAVNSSGQFPKSVNAWNRSSTSTHATAAWALTPLCFRTTTRTFLVHGYTAYTRRAATQTSVSTEIISTVTGFRPPSELPSSPSPNLRQTRYVCVVKCLEFTFSQTVVLFRNFHNSWFRMPRLVASSA